MGLSWDDDVSLKKYQKELRTNKVLVCKTAGYDEYYILPSIPKMMRMMRKVFKSKRMQKLVI